MAPPKKLFEDMYSDQTLVLYVTRKNVMKQSNPWISHTHDKKHITCKMVQEEKKIMLYHLTNIWAPIAFSKCGLQWCSSFLYSMLKIPMHMEVFISSEGYVKKSLKTIDRGKNAYIRTANTVRTYLHINNGKREKRLKSKTKTRNNYNKE